MQAITKEIVVSKLPKRPVDANKGTFGSALIIAGSKNYPGAAILSCLACARSGVGLVTLATDESTYKVAVPKIPFATFLRFSEIEKNLDKYDAVLIGPGLGQSEEANKFITKLINLQKLKETKLVLDADALSLKVLDFDAILTPHPGEMARLTGLLVDVIQKDRQKVALEFAKKWNKTIILKGAETVIANSKGEVYKSEFANPLLATAGTGDVLSGIITGLLAQGLNLTDASIVGVYIHGLAGEKLKKKFGVSGALSTDLIKVLSEVFKDLYPKADGLLKHPRQFV